MAKPNKVSDPKMFTANWQERDDALLTELLHTKIKELKWEIKMASSPYMARQLKVKRREYKEMLRKVSLGQYDGNIILSELTTAVRYKNTEKNKKEKVLSKYVSSYADVDFDFESYFSRTRYYGAALPLFTLILVGIMLFCSIMSAVIPAQTNTINDTLASGEMDIWLDLSTVGYLKVGNGNDDFLIPNDGNWPIGKYKEGITPLAQGKKYIDSRGNIPTSVLMYEQLGMIAVNITVVDVMKAFFRTPLMSKNKIDFIENLPVMQGTSWYVQAFMKDPNSLKIQKGADGNYDFTAIIRNIATYGTIFALLLTLLSAIIVIIFCIFRIFRYTSKRIHFFTFMTFFCGVLTMILPAFAKVQSMSGIGDALSGYFALTQTMFVESTTTIVSVNLISLILVVLPFLAMFMPLMFKNKRKYQVTHVPKGNKPPYDDGLTPDKLNANRAKQKNKNQAAKGKSRINTPVAQPMPKNNVSGQGAYMQQQQINRK